MNVSAEPLSRKAIRNITTELRKILGCEKQRYFPIVQCLEWVLSNPDAGMDFEILTKEEMQNTYGTTNTGHYLLHQPENIRACSHYNASQIITK